MLLRRFEHRNIPSAKGRFHEPDFKNLKPKSLLQMGRSFRIRKLTDKPMVRREPQLIVY